MHHFASVCHWTKIHWIIIHISGSIAPRVMGFGMGFILMISRSTLKVKVIGQRSRSRDKKCVLGDFA